MITIKESKTGREKLPSSYQLFMSDNETITCLTRDSLNSTELNVGNAKVITLTVGQAHKILDLLSTTINKGINYEIK